MRKEAPPPIDIFLFFIEKKNSKNSRSQSSPSPRTRALPSHCPSHPRLPPRRARPQTLTVSDHTVPVPPPQRRPRQEEGSETVTKRTCCAMPNGHETVYAVPILWPSRAD